MFGTDKNGNTLHNHLIADGFFANDIHTLSIIDDYHTKDINPDAIAFFREGFRDTGLTNIVIFYQVKEIRDTTRHQIGELAHKLNTNPNELSAFLVFLLTSVNSNKKTLEQILVKQYHSFSVDNVINSSLQFVNSMAEIGITVQYQPYSSLHFKPPFHGRYWINPNKGYIVDGSLDTYSHGKIFAQLMDQENFDIISGLLNNEIIPNTRQYDVLSGREIERMHRMLREYFN